ncbi:MAG: hypothetical protein IT196_18340 [Acidimicrobiales bacterium]|nr:hypothetical protein [Acidimicrobiales bacterium]
MPYIDVSTIVRRVGVACWATAAVLAWRPPLYVLCVAAVLLLALAASEVVSARAARRRPNLTLVAGSTVAL